MSNQSVIISYFFYYFFFFKCFRNNYLSVLTRIVVSQLQKLRIIRHHYIPGTERRKAGC